MSILLSRNERFFVQVTHPWAATIPNAAGVASLAAGDACRHINLDLARRFDVIRTAAKTGAAGLLAGISGRTGGTWRTRLPFQLSGAAGTAPDMDQLLQAMFGQAPTIVASTSVTYNQSDQVSGLTLWSFRTAPDGTVTNVQQRVAWGAVVQDFSIATVEGELIAELGGPCGFVLDSANFASYSADQKAGLTAFPVEPASPTYTGNIIAGWRGTATINGVATFLVESFSVIGRFNRDIRHAFGKREPSVPIQGVREIMCTFRLFEENIANQNTLRDLQRSQTTFDITFEFGDQAGYKAAFALNNVVLPGETLDDSGPEYILGFADVTASMTSATAKDELILTLT